jgi:hypothetical protein
VLEQNRRLHSVIIALEEENATCKHLLDQTTDLVNTLKVFMKYYVIYVRLMIIYFFYLLLFISH